MICRYDKYLSNLFLHESKREWNDINKKNNLFDSNEFYLKEKSCFSGTDLRREKLNSLEYKISKRRTKIKG